MAAYDTEAQCLISDGGGNFYLCPRYKREEGEAYFADMQKDTSVPVSRASKPPSFLTRISSLQKLHFYRPIIEDGGNPSIANEAAISEIDTAMEKN